MKKIIVLTLLTILSISYAQAANPELDKQLHEIIKSNVLFASPDQDKQIKQKLFDILKKGANPNSNQSGIPAIVLATEFENMPAIELLLSFKANPNAKDPSGMSALLIAAGQQNAWLVDKLLSAQNIDVNIQDNDGRNALMSSVLQGRLDIIESLLKAKANVNIKSKDGQTALSLAELRKKEFVIPEQQENYQRIISALKKAGAK